VPAWIFYLTKYELRLAWDVGYLFRLSAGLDEYWFEFYQTKYELLLNLAM